MSLPPSPSSPRPRCSAVMNTVVRGAAAPKAAETAAAPAGQQAAAATASEGCAAVAAQRLALMVHTPSFCALVTAKPLPESRRVTFS